MKIYLGKQHYIENFNYEKFIKEYKNKSYVEQKAFIDSFDISTNQEWLSLKRGNLGASNASKFLSDSIKLSSLKRTKKWLESTEIEKEFLLAEYEVEEKLGESCKELAYKILAERMTAWQDEEMSWSEKTSVKRGLVFESFASDIYQKLTGKELVDVLYIKKDDLFGFSPDKLVVDENEKVVLEIKNFEPPAYLKAILDSEKKETIEQVQMQIFAGELDRVDVMYCSPEMNSFKIVRHFRDENYMLKFKKRAEEFNEYLDILKEKIKTSVVDIK